MSPAQIDPDLSGRGRVPLDQSGHPRVFTLLHDARPVLLNLGEPGGLDIRPWADRVQLIDAKYAGPRKLPVLGHVAAPAAELIRPDGYVAWVGTAPLRIRVHGTDGYVEILP